jgi:glutathione S-transferase
MMSKQSINTTSSESIKNLALYHYPSCPFCGITAEAIKNMEKGASDKQIVFKIDQRDILKQPEYRNELIKGGGKPQVPCLKIETGNGATHWLYESSAIIEFLQQRYVDLTNKGKG